MKPIQVIIQKPESKDWVKPYTLSPTFEMWYWNDYMIIEKFSKSKFKASLVMIYKDEEIELGDFNTLSEAQEACFQHYLKSIGADIWNH